MARGWYRTWMRGTIDKAGRIVIPKSLRDAVGLAAGEVELIPDGAGVRIEAVAGRGVSEESGRLVIDGMIDLDDDAVRALRLTDQR
jgi:AbrB family looped-hinge helix DNA binding protein